MTEAANCALSISMPTDEITIFILFDATKVRKRFHTTKLFGQKMQRKLKIISDKLNFTRVFIDFYIMVDITCKMS